MTKKLCTYGDAADTLSVTTQMIGKLVERGDLTRVNVGGTGPRSARILVSSVDDYVDRLAMAAAASKDGAA